MEDWSRIEDELIVADYFEMLHFELSGLPYSKTEHRKKLLSLIKRSEGSIEFKHANISAALIKMGLPYINGYKPRSNYQKELLEDVILNYLKKNKAIEKDFNNFSNNVIEYPPKKIEFKNWNVEPPEMKETFKEPAQKYFTPVKKNYLEIEQKNVSHGMLGEKLVYDYEIWRLHKAELPQLAEQVKWVSKDQGDGAGYDIFSKSTSGKDMLIEVKATSLGIKTPIFFSSTENELSVLKPASFFLYRVFDLKEDPKLFIKNGRFEDMCDLEAISFKGYF